MIKLLTYVRPSLRHKHIDEDDDQNDRNRARKEPKVSSTQRPSGNPTCAYPAALLEELLSHVCPHSKDDNYTPCEESMIDGGCMLCDMRDLSQCGLVNKQWSEAAHTLLYHNVRLDSVHYCDREAELATKRKRRSFTRRQRDLTDTSHERLVLLARTLRENEAIAHQVQYLKIPYMTRESFQADLARTVSLLPNLRYVDLPDGCFNGDLSSSTLKLELQSRCPNIQKMRYASGAEGSFQMLTQARQWPGLEALDLLHLAVESSNLVRVLASFVALREVRLIGLSMLNDAVFRPVATVGSFLGKTITSSKCFPPLAKLSIQDTPNVSAEGLVTYLSQTEAHKTLSSLVLINTEISLSKTHQILATAPHLTDLFVSQRVSHALPPSTPSLASLSLRSFHYEVFSPGSSPQPIMSSSDSYYAYLSTSVLSGSMPSLCHLYALSPRLPLLLLPPERSVPAFDQSTVESTQSSVHLSHTLRLYTKAISELEWNLTFITLPTSSNLLGGATVARSLSLHNTPLVSPQSRDKGRGSVIVGNGFGGFLAMPSGDSEPRSLKTREKRDETGAWMG